MICLVNKADVAQFVRDLLHLFGSVLPSITIINPEKFGVSYVSIVIDTSSEDTVKNWVQNSYGLHTITWQEITPAG